jgi:hypothetical protein
MAVRSSPGARDRSIQHGIVDVTLIRFDRPVFTHDDFSVGMYFLQLHVHWPQM